ncbi:mitofilin family membrane protein [Brucella sp. bbatCR03]|uniref:COG4223 family protein n=1 Tax=Brucella sp. bbatCR03 TaxID=2942452 RepID=UPI0024E165EA|nr:mitofilin family membrane protein [Brucella sp. bbatCR03]
MAKSGTPRHSKPARNPVTINLDPSEVKRVDEPAAAKATPAAEPVGGFSGKAEAKPAAQAAPASSTGPDKAPFTAGVKPEAESPRETANAAPSAATPPADGRSGGGASHLLAGVAGGVIALGGMFALQWGNVIPAPAPLDDAGKAEFARLQKNVEAAEIKAEAVAGTLSELQKQIEALPTTSENGTAAGDIASLSERLDALETKLSETRSQADEASAGVSGNSGTISSLESKLTSLQEKMSETARQPDAAVLIAANALKTAIDRGGSFKAELDTYVSVAPQDASVEGLRAYADKGVPTIADLNAWFGAVANRIVATENKLPADASLWDQLLASARGLVSVRPVAGNVSGTGVGPTTARMEAALQAGDLDRAIGEWEQLPADAKAVSEEFASQMKARRDADALVQRLVADSLKPKAPVTGASDNTTGEAPASSGQ